MSPLLVCSYREVLTMEVTFEIVSHVDYALQVVEVDERDQQHAKGVVDPKATLKLTAKKMTAFALKKGSLNRFLMDSSVARQLFESSGIYAFSSNLSHS